jgi:hypothetical protein
MHLFYSVGDGQREPDSAPLQGQRLQAGGPRTGKIFPFISSQF